MMGANVHPRRTQLVATFFPGKCVTNAPFLFFVVTSLAVGWKSACGDGPSPDDVTDLQGRVASLSQRVNELAPREDLLDSLHFGWFDRPYARATLATLSKTSAVLRREVRLRNAGNGAITGATLSAMLHWAEDAADRVLADEPDPRFRPHRLPITTGAIVDGAAPPLFAFLDRATATRLHSAFGDFDLLAAIGGRVYAREASDLADAEHFQMLVRRAEFVGVPVVAVLPNRTAAESAVSGSATPTTDWLQVQPLTITDLITRASFNEKAGRPAVTDPVAGEPWASRVARRALVRGVTRRSGYVVCGWNADATERTSADGGRPTAAAMWVDATDGLSLAIAGGWRDLRDGSGSTSPSAFTRPDEIESFARTSLDILRFVGLIRSVEAASRPAGIVIVVSPDAVDPLDANRWADWIEPFFAALVERQITFDIVSDAVNREVYDVRYSVIFPLKRDDASDLKITIVRLERELASLEGFAHRQTIRGLDGAFPGDLFVRAPGSKDRPAPIVVVNLSGAPRELALIGGGNSLRLRDVLSGSLTIGRDGRFTLGPWQSCLFAQQQ